MSNNPFDNLDQKTFRDGIIELLETEYKLVGSHKIIELIANDIVDLEIKYHPRNKKTQLGSLSWVSTSDKNKKPKLGQKRSEYKQEVVELPYITKEDIELKRKGISKVEHDRLRIERLTKAAKKQGAMLTVEERAAIMNRSAVTISKRIGEYHETHDDILPLKGYILDMGRGTTHKKAIIELYEQKVQPPDIARKTEHSLNAVDRYIKDYERVKFLIRRGISTTQIKHMTGRGASVIKQYRKLIERYHPEYTDNNK